MRMVAAIGYGLTIALVLLVFDVFVEHMRTDYLVWFVSIPATLAVLAARFPFTMFCVGIVIAFVLVVAVYLGSFDEPPEFALRAMGFYLAHVAPLVVPFLLESIVPAALFKRRSYLSRRV